MSYIKKNNDQELFYETICQYILARHDYLDELMSYIKDFPKLLAEEYQRYWSRIKKVGPTQREKREGPSAGWFLSHSQDVEKFLIDSLKKNEFELEPLIKSEIVKGTKKRIIYVPNQWDRFVVGTLRAYLTAKVEPQFSDSLHSFRQGRGPLTAVLSARKFVHSNKQKKIYVFQRDITKYGDNIISSKLVKTTLDKVFHEKNEKDDLVESLVKKIVNWKIYNEQGDTYVMSKGIPAGTPLVPFFENIYLSEIDHSMAEYIKSGDLFYARYGDDIIVLSTSVQLAESVIEQIETKCADLGLDIKNKKSINFELGLKSRIKWLGMHLDKKGCIGTSHEDIKSFKSFFKSEINKSWHKAIIWKKYANQKKGVEDLWLNQLKDILSYKYNPYLVKMIHLKDGSTHLKEIDSWIRKEIVKFMFKNGVAKKNAWRILRRSKLPSLNYLRRRKLSVLERKRL